MPTATYIALANTTLSSTATSITFSSIPATYRDLVIIVEGTAGANNPLDIEFNGDTTNGNYFNITAYQQAGDSATSFTVNESYAGVNWYPSNGRTILTVNIMDYSATDKHKTYLSRSGGASAWIGMAAVRWANTNAINTVRLDLRGGTFLQGVSFALYGIVS